MSPVHTNHPAAGSGGHDEQAAALVALAREVEALRERLEPLNGLDQRLTELAHTVADLANEVTAHHCRPTPGPAASWLDLPDGSHNDEPVEPERAEELLGDLADWVQRIYLRYADAAKSFPECWLYHPDVVEELTWLRHAWCCAYQTQDAAPALAWDWHDRYRPGVAARIHRLAGRCSLDQHTSGQTGAAPVALGLGGLTELAAWWAQHRHTTPPAPPAAVLEQAREAQAARLRTGARP